MNRILPPNCAAKTNWCRSMDLSRPCISSAPRRLIMEERRIIMSRAQTVSAIYTGGLAPDVRFHHDSGPTVISRRVFDTPLDTRSRQLLMVISTPSHISQLLKVRRIGRHCERYASHSPTRMGSYFIGSGLQS